MGDSPNWFFQKSARFFHGVQFTGSAIKQNLLKPLIPAVKKMFILKPRIKSSRNGGQETLGGLLSTSRPAKGSSFTYEVDIIVSANRKMVE